MTYNYAKTILGLMTRVKDDKGKVRFRFRFGATTKLRVSIRQRFDYGSKFYHHLILDGDALVCHTYGVQSAGLDSRLLLLLLSLCVQVLIIGGGIANFTDVAATFTGIITALKQYAEELRDGNITIWVRRAGPNYQEVQVCSMYIFLCSWALLVWTHRAAVLSSVDS